MCSKLPIVTIASLLVCLIMLRVEGSSKTPTVMEKMQEDTDLSEFFELLQANAAAKSTLLYRHVTVFAPTNRAFQKTAISRENSDIILYHMTNSAKSLRDLGSSISSELDGNPPLWVTRKKGYPEDEIYINNARILNGSDFRAIQPLQGGVGKHQYLHRISEVLLPIQPISRERAANNPNAFEFMNQSETFQLGDFRMRTFRQRVFHNDKDSVFKADGKFTFFIPDEEGFKPSMRPIKIDRQVIDGHVIPDHVLFTAPAPNDKPYRTLADGDNFRVELSFVKDPDNNGKIYVKSNTISGDSNHPVGVVLAEIVKPNIAVRNGVVHLIQRPLMVVDAAVHQFLQDKENGPVYKFYQAIRDYGDDFIEEITRIQDITLFAPSNAAWEEYGVQNILQDRQKFREILKLHYVRERLPLDKIKEKSLHNVPTAAAHKELFFNVAERYDGQKVVTVEGGGVNATIVTANIAATNGIIHIIDRVLGVPYTTVLDKLRTDPMLNETYQIGQRRNFNHQLNDTKKRFTYFVPSNAAWEFIKFDKPSIHSKLHLSGYTYHTKQLLERHLVISDKKWSMAALKNASINGEIELRAQRDVLKIRIKEQGGSYKIIWNGEVISVVRPDVTCTNGIIHVIDRPLLTPDDVTVTDDRDGGASISTLAPHLIMIMIAKWLL